MSWPLEIAPFRALRYAPEAAHASIDQLVSPPYDVIDAKSHQALAAKSAFNAVHMILPPLEHHDEYKKGSFQYSNYSARLASWLQQKVLVRDAAPGIYVVHQTYGDPLQAGAKRTRKGVIALKRLSEFGEGGVRPHEKTLPGPKADRLNLLREVKANLSPIFGLYADREGAVDKMIDEALQTVCPIYDLITHEPEPIEHKVWKIEEPGLLKKICEKLSGPMIIADGHHRYETALNYCRELESADPKLPTDGGQRYMPIYLANLYDPGLVILPTHRLVHDVSALSVEAFLKSIAGDFDVKVLPAPPKNPGDLERILPADGPVAFVLYASQALGPQRTHLLALKAARMPKDPAAALDVAVLQEKIFFQALNMSQADVETQKKVSYTRSLPEALAWADAGRIQLAFLTRPPSAEQVTLVCESGARMPQKSTYFFPKVPTGLVFRPVDPHERVGF